MKQDPPPKDGGEGLLSNIYIKMRAKVGFLKSRTGEEERDRKNSRRDVSCLRG